MPARSTKAMNANYNHSEFEELCALASAGALSGVERQKLESHLRTCVDCADAYREYRLLSTEGMPLLASTYAHPQAVKNWDDRIARKALLARVRGTRAESELRRNFVRISI